ncbi:hypothetical protein MHBO_000772 [Bonamia ostreae]|uniref:LAGLIDADG homing endonuclease n=1 Tax=Bonamia ostreae TaxID=126728 RepID=A0ABV2AHZ4_9EUKA
MPILWMSNKIFNLNHVLKFGDKDCVERRVELTVYNKETMEIQFFKEIQLNLTKLSERDEFINTTSILKTYRSSFDSEKCRYFKQNQFGEWFLHRYFATLNSKGVYNRL